MKTKSWIAIVAVAWMLMGSAHAAGISGVKTIQVENALGTWLQISELVAIQTGTGTNVALTSNGGVGSANSDWGNAGQQKPLDGVAPAAYPNIYHSGGTGAGFYYFLTLSAPYELDSLTIYGRTDCCSERDAYNVTLKNSSGQTLFTGFADARNTSHSATLDLRQTAAVPEPATLATFLTGLASLSFLAYRRKRQS
jgi:hypothetical protein